MYKCYFYFITCLELEWPWYRARRPGPEVALAKARTNFLKLEEAQNLCILKMKVKPAESSNLTKKHDLSLAELKTNYPIKLEAQKCKRYQ